jgi:hypothetical protein
LAGIEKFDGSNACSLTALETSARRSRRQSQISTSRSGAKTSLLLKGSYASPTQLSLHALQLQNEATLKADRCVAGNHSHPVVSSRGNFVTQAYVIGLLGLRPR